MSGNLLRRMADISEIPYSSRPGRDCTPAAGKAGAGRPALVAAAVCAAIVAGSALLGLLAGLAWTALAPHVVLVATGGGSANVVNPETSAFIVADGWFAVLCALGGVVCGLLGWALAVRRHGVLAVLGLLGGGVAAAQIARWAGQRSGQAAFSRQLAASRPGALLRAPVSLGAHGAIAFWPLAACLVVGGIEMIRLLRDRRLAAAGRPVPALAPAAADRPEQADGW
jgi:hypothetical protein